MLGQASSAMDSLSSATDVALEDDNPIRANCTQLFDLNFCMFADLACLIQDTGGLIACLCKT